VLSRPIFAVKWAGDTGGAERVTGRGVEARPAPGGVPCRGPDGQRLLTVPCVANRISPIQNSQVAYQQSYMPKKTNHVLHLILTLISCGLWAPVWIVMAIINANSKDVVTTYTAGFPPQQQQPPHPGPPAPGYGPQYPPQ
jgi:hypothetical protein